MVIDSDAERAGRPNSMNIERLHQLCAFLGEHPDLFAVETVGALAQRLGSGAVLPEKTAVPQGRRSLRYGRFAEQAYKRLAARLPL